MTLLLALVLCAPDSDRLYVANSTSGDLTVVDVDTREVVKTIAASVVGHHPDDVIASRDGAVLYVSRAADDAHDVIAVSSTNDQVLWKVAVGGEPNHLTLSRDERFLYVPLFDKGQLVVIDVRSHAIVARPDVCKGAHSTQLSRDGARVWVGCLMEPALVAVEVGGKHAVVQRIATPEGVRPFQFSSDGKLVYAQLTRTHGLVVIDVAKGAVVRTIEGPTLGRPVPAPTEKPSYWVQDHGLALSPDGRWLIAGATLMGFVAIYAMPQLELYDVVPIGNEPEWVVFARDSSVAFVTNRADGTVSVISPSQRKELQRIKAGVRPQRMTVASPPPRKP